MRLTLLEARLHHVTPETRPSVGLVAVVEESAINSIACGVLKITAFGCVGHILCRQLTNAHTQHARTHEYPHTHTNTHTIYTHTLKHARKHTNGLKQINSI
jgi:hypothetical protein